LLTLLVKFNLISDLEAADEENEYHAFATAYNYFMNLGKKKISWSVHL